MSCKRSLIRGAVRKLPCDTTGFAPIKTRRSVRLRSGIGTEVGVPYSSWLAISRLLVSCEEAVKKWVRRPSPLMKAMIDSTWA